MRRDPAGPGSRGGNLRLDAGFPEVFGGSRVDRERGGYLIAEAMRSLLWSTDRSPR